MNPESLKQGPVLEDQERSLLSEEAIANAMDLGEQFRIGSDYSTGSHGKPKDIRKAVLYLLKAAESGHHLAVYNLAALYVDGTELPQNLEIAREYAMKLGSMGSAEAADRVLTEIDAKQNELSAVNQRQGVMASPERDPNEAKDEPSKGSSVWPPILFLGGIALLLYIAGEVDRDSPGAGRTFIGWVFGLGALGVFLNIVLGPTVKQTSKNLTDLMKNVALTLLGIFILGSIGYCSGGLNFSHDIGRENVLDQVRKP